jgi:hypothetical protein
MVSLKDKGNKAEDYVLVNGGERFKVTRIEDHDGDDYLPFLVHFENDGCYDQWYVDKNGVYDNWHLESVRARGAVDLRQDSNPQHYTFIDKEGGENEVVSIKDSTNRALPYRIEYKDRGGGKSHFVFAWNGDSKGIDGDEYDIGYLIQKNSLRIYDFGNVEANAHDIQIHYEDYGDTVKLVEVINVLSVSKMVEKFGPDWFDNHYRRSTPKTDFIGSTPKTDFIDGDLYIYEGEGDYHDTKRSVFTIGETYNKEEFMRGMELVQEAAKNLSRLRKEFGVSKKKTITI